MLVPAGVLVLFILGSIAVDSAVAFLAQRELNAAAAAAANDAAGSAVSNEAFYRGTGGTAGDIILDEATAERVADAALKARAPRGIADIRREVHTAGNQVCVTVTGRVAYIFAKAIPGGPRWRTVTGQAVATAIQGEDTAGALGNSSVSC